jgi:purine nucleoside permease
MAKYAKVEGAERDSLVADDAPGAAAAAAAESSSSSFPWRSELLLLVLGVCAGAALAAVALALPASKADAIEVKVVIVALFDAEAGLWLARGAAGQTLDHRLEFPQGYRCDPCRSAAAGGTAAAAGDGPELYLNAETGVLLVITGMGTAWSAASIMGLGMDARFNLRRAYWLVAGIAGIDPQMGSVGSGAWADWVVEADLAHYIDAREMPADWEHPFFPMRAPGATISAPWGTAPSAVPTDPSFDDSMAVQLDTGLVNWAFALTVDTPLADSAALRASRAPYAGYPQALRPPFVLRGDNAVMKTLFVAVFQHKNAHFTKTGSGQT